MSQSALGRAVGLTFQQIQKYERGTNRAGASRLYEFAHVLNVPVSYFFEDMSAAGGGAPGRSSGRGPGRIKGRPGGALPPGHDSDLMIRRETLELVRAYFKIRKQATRRQIATLIGTLA